ncbi:class I SAM-dependent methyltransferase [Ktedonosporobacter rubrisoli]|uniref:Class I SAM-dependent methyltransferase n=1 Tax=Ktedonosporobacter rubrisoli TaxID=2509675 RepID=A0A4P6JXA0_KTERU|nr:methyltransferase [Ktedonosporobacter rubrisoli]QBD80033.1 class I SAM-dependent methyltransferase [Ktedonosporobacter rubrisoli]
MILPSCLLCDTVQLSAEDRVLVLNSAADPFVSYVAKQPGASLVLAEDNLANATAVMAAHPRARMSHCAFHDYILHHPPATLDVAVMNLLYQPSNAWMHYALEVAAYALKPGGHLYITGSKDRGILSFAKRMQDAFGPVETLLISKGQRVLRARKAATTAPPELPGRELKVFASNQLDEGTRLLLEALEVRETDEALDIGCGGGFIGLHIARQAIQGQVTMVDVSLAAVAASQRAIAQSGLPNIRALPSDGARAVLEQRFDLVATNPPFHQGGIQTKDIAERFIREAAQVLRPQGRFYLVANRFLKYEPVLATCFKTLEEVGGNTRYKVLLARMR